MQTFGLGLGFKQMRKPRGQDPGFTRARPCKNQQRPVKRFHSVTLLGIQIIEICRGRRITKTHFRAGGEFINFEGIIHHGGIYITLCSKDQPCIGCGRVFFPFCNETGTSTTPFPIFKNFLRQFFRSFA